MRYFKEDKEIFTSSFSSLSDDELIQDVVHTMWEITSKKSNRLMAKLKSYHDEIHISRKKPYLWNKAKDCFNVYRKKETDFFNE